MSGEYDFLYKILVLGDSGVGKSSLLFRFAEDTFSDSLISTSGVDFKTKTLTLDDKVIKLQIWDMACWGRWRTLTTCYFRGTHGFIVVYDVTDRRSFDNIKQWMLNIDHYASDGVPRLFVGNKNDLVDRKEVDYTTAREYAESLKVPLIETSAKNGTNVEQAFVTMAVQIMTHLKTETQPDILEKGDRIELSEKVGIAKSTCCC